MEKARTEGGAILWQRREPLRTGRGPNQRGPLFPSTPLTSDLLLTKARKPRSRLAEEFRDP